MEMGVVPGGGSIMVHLLKFETEIRKKLTDANAATQVRAPLHKSVYVCVFVLCMCVCACVVVVVVVFS
jgi:magnesium-transporting ATPase (P-type)